MKDVEDDLSGAAIIALSDEQLADLARLSPVESMQALNPGELKQPQLNFCCIWQEDALS